MCAAVRLSAKNLFDGISNVSRLGAPFYIRIKSFL